MIRKNLIYVLGMTRSGTSALTRVLSLCGGLLPQKLEPADELNPTGYWEPADALGMNDRFLRRHGSSWFDSSLQIPINHALVANMEQDFINEVRKFLVACPSGPNLLIKDSRITAISEYWFEAARREGYIVQAIVPIRHPQEVAKSWLAANISESFSHALWLKYNLLAERCTRNIPRVFVDYANFIEDWRTEIVRIERGLSVKFRLDSDVEVAVNTFLQKDLKKQRCTISVSQLFGKSWIARTYDMLSSAARDQSPSVDHRSLDEIFDSYASEELSLRRSIANPQL